MQVRSWIMLTVILTNPGVWTASVWLLPLSRWRGFYRVHPVNLSVWKETRLNYRWQHRFNFQRCYHTIVKGKHRTWTTGGSLAFWAWSVQKLSQWNTWAKCWLNVKGRVFCLSARSFPLQVGRCGSRKHKVTESILGGMKRIFIGG